MVKRNHIRGFPAMEVKDHNLAVFEEDIHNFLHDNGVPFQTGYYGGNRMIFVFFNKRDRNFFLLNYSQTFRSYEFYRAI
jgi:hypothetical protein